MELVVFDIDGTLTDTNEVDARCFVRALELAFDVADGSSNWEDYLHVTDSGITREVFRRRYDRLPEASETEVFVERFLELLGDAFRSDPGEFEEVSGAGHLLETLPVASDWRVGMATGGWRASAEFKLRCADIPLDGVPISTANDAVSREEIFRQCVSRARP